MEIQLECIRGEERDGYYVQPLMRRRWAVQLDILREIDSICKRYQIKYFGWYGTLLGAVRHQGFIPWDDDIDLVMPREDYERFQCIFQKESPNGGKVLKTNPTMITIVNTDVIRLDQAFLDQYHGCPLISGVDVFAWDAVPPNRADEEVWMNLFWAACNLYVHWDLFKDDVEWKKEKWIQLEELENLTGCHIDRKSSVKEQLYVLTDKIAAMYGDTEHKEVTYLPDLCKDSHHRIPELCFNRVMEMPFEDTVIPVLEDYDLICRLSYGGDYMTPVKEYAHEDGIKNQIKILQDFFNRQGMDLPECFTMTFE